MRAGARRPCAVCACGRFPHLSVPQQQAASAYKRPFHGAGDGGAGRADGGGSSESSAQEPHHPRFGRGTGCGGGFRRKRSKPPGHPAAVQRRAEQLRFCAADRGNAGAHAFL